MFEQDLPLNPYETMNRDGMPEDENRCDFCNRQENYCSCEDEYNPEDDYIGCW